MRRRLAGEGDDERLPLLRAARERSEHSSHGGRACAGVDGGGHRLARHNQSHLQRHDPWSAAVRFVSCARRGWAVENYLRRARLEGRLAWEGLEGLKLLHRRHALIWLPRTRLQVHARAADE